MASLRRAAWRRPPRDRRAARPAGCLSLGLGLGLRRRHSLALSLGLAQCLGLSACLPLGAGRQLEADVASLRLELARQGRAATAARAADDEAQAIGRRRVEELAAALQQLTRSSRQTDADFEEQLARIVHDLQDLRGALELAEHRLGESEGRQAASADAKVAQLAGGGAAAAAAATDEAPTLPKDKAEALAAAVALLGGEHAADGRTMLRAIVRTWPQELGVTDEALFRLGQAAQADKKYEGALQAYVRIVDKFSGSSHVAEAYYNIGLCSLELGRGDDAQTFFGEVVNNYRKSPFAPRARAKLDELARRPTGRTRAKKR